jgi:hypothetical protein
MLGSSAVDKIFEIALPETGAVLPIPLGAFSGVPLPLALRGAAGLLPVA